MRLPFGGHQVLWSYMRHSILLKSFLIVAALAAVGGAEVLALTRSNEVRGSSETAVQEPVARVEGAPEMMPEAADAPAAPDEGAGLSADDRAAAYLRQLRTSDLTTYVHPSGAFLFRYPRDFELLTQRNEDEQVVNVLHPHLPLEICTFHRI
jgi:hypothetical protein